MREPQGRSFLGINEKPLFHGPPTPFISCADGGQLESQIESTVNHKWRAHGLVLSLSLSLSLAANTDSDRNRNGRIINCLSTTSKTPAAATGIISGEERERESAMPSCLPPLMVCGGGGVVRSTVSVRRACHGASKEISIAIEEGRREGALTALLSSRSKSRVLLSSRCN